MAKILIVDDEKALVELISSVVEDLGHEPLCAYDGCEAFKIARVHKPGIIFCDIMMPVLGGYELLRLIREDKDLGGVPVVMMSASKIDPVRAIQANAFMPKPFDLERVAEYIEKLVN